MEWDDKIHKALVHPIRRRIIECLQEKDLSFQELLECLAIGNHGRLDFHLRTLSGLVEHEIPTNKYHLTDRGQLASELLWDIRFLTRRAVKDLTNEPTRYVRRLRFGDHAILFYNKEDVKRKIAFSFLEAGLLKGEAVVYLVSEHKMDSEVQEIQRFGITTDDSRNEAFTIMSAYEWYIKKGEAQAETIIANWQALLKAKQKAGFTGLRVAGETEVFFDYAKVKELLRYEMTLGRQLAFDMCGLCIYRHGFDEKLFTQLQQSHGHSIFKGIAFKTI
jgi:hypothetical protein